MFILMSKKNVRKVIFGVKIFSLILLLIFAITELNRLYHQYDFNNKMWLKEDNPSGNPLKVQTKGILVENDEKNTSKEINNSKETKDNLLNKLKEDLQWFYKGEDGGK